MRCFVAVDIDNKLKEAIIGLQKQISGAVKLVEPQNLHFTLKFLGEADEKLIADVSSRLQLIASKFRPFDANIKGMGVFPSENYIRVIWVGCDDLFNLQNTVENTLAPLFKKEKPVPHLTIARVHSSNGHVKEFIEKNKYVEIGMMWIDKIQLKKSTLTKRGPIYEDVETFELKGYDI